MKRNLLLLGVLVAALAFSGCFEGETEEPCAGPACDGEVSLVEKDKEDPVVDDQLTPEDPVDEQAIELPDPEVQVAVPSATYVYKQATEYLPKPQGEDTPTPTGITIDDLTPAELAKIDTLRTAIDFGLDVGRFEYVESVSIALQMKGLVDDYESSVEDGFVGLEQVPEPCPFAKYYDNGFEPTGDTCDYLADMAKVEVYSELSNVLDQFDLPGEVQESPDFDEAFFWYEQGAISGVEEERVKVKFDLQQTAVCDAEPTPVESSFEKGVLTGRQHFAQKFNEWLAANGYKADYPIMSQPIQVCNADVSMLVPSKSTALQTVELKANSQPLCDNYVAPTQEGMQQYALAEIDYRKGMKKGIDDEFGLAAVKVFQVIPCNVSDPIVVDLDGDGIELVPIHQGVNFDLYGVGHEQAVAWVAPDDGFLALDRNGNGVVDNGLELFGNVDSAFADGFHHLSVLDGNMDGALTTADAAFVSLVVWKDANSDGISTTDEVVPLAAYGVDNIDLDAVNVMYMSAGNRIPKASVATGAVNFMLGDAFLSSAPYPRL